MSPEQNCNIVKIAWKFETIFFGNMLKLTIYIILELKTLYERKIDVIQFLTVVGFSDLLKLHGTEQNHVVNSKTIPKQAHLYLSSFVAS